MTIDKSQFEPGTEEWMALAFPKAETRPVRDEDVDLVAYKLEQWDMKDPPNDCTGHDYRDTRGTFSQPYPALKPRRLCAKPHSLTPNTNTMWPAR
jgi:hypothetical protein